MVLDTLFAGCLLAGVFVHMSLWTQYFIKYVDEFNQITVAALGTKINWLDFEGARSKFKVTTTPNMARNPLLVTFSHHGTLNDDSLNWFGCIMVVRQFWTKWVQKVKGQGHELTKGRCIHDASHHFLLSFLYELQVKKLVSAYCFTLLRENCKYIVITVLQLATHHWYSSPLKQTSCDKRNILTVFASWNWPVIMIIII